MKNKKYKILVLSDLKDTTQNVLKSSISLAKMVNGEINFFHVKKPLDVIKRDNQLSAMRSLNQGHTAIEKEIQSMLWPISDAYNVPIDYSFSIGNIKTEIEVYINEYQPDIIVLGKRNPKMIKFIGDSITNFVLNKFDGAIMMVANSKDLEPNKKLSFGLFNSQDQTFNSDFTEHLITNAQKPLTSFSVIKKGSDTNKIESSSDQKVIAYTFEDSADAIGNISKYLSKTKIDVLLVNRMKNKAKTPTSFVNTTIKDLMDDLNISLLIGNKSASKNLV
ncbi:universal stress protein [Cellulophaga sp. Hel_I_12]|uniref:universal stress protein n=1 Tax=Cellulophaga sp. Hel_I_12 TaxID=1249972 RepID=UPI000646D717|nr:universal stress protein [Cellulophaga sp. Hel_I_12]